jgi:hypothetical protein
MISLDIRHNSSKSMLAGGQIGPEKRYQEGRKTATHQLVSTITVTRKGEVNTRLSPTLPCFEQHLQRKCVSRLSKVSRYKLSKTQQGDGVVVLCCCVGERKRKFGMRGEGHA